MHLIAMFAVLCILGMIFPRLMKYFVAAPLCGLAVGGLIWGLAVPFMPMALFTLRTLSAFLLGGIFVAELVAVSNK